MERSADGQMGDGKWRDTTKIDGPGYDATMSGDDLFVLDNGLGADFMPDILDALDADPDLLMDGPVLDAQRWREIDRFPATESLTRMAAGMTDPMWSKAARGALAAVTLWEGSRHVDLTHLMTEAAAKVTQGGAGLRLSHALVVDRVAHDGDPVVRAHAASLLPMHLSGASRSHGLSGIMRQAMDYASQDPDERVRLALARAIGETHASRVDENCVRMLLAFTGDPDHAVRSAAFHALAACTAESQVSPAVRESAYAWIGQAVHSDNAEAARAAALMVVHDAGRQGGVGMDEAQFLIPAMRLDPSLAREVGDVVLDPATCSESARMRLMDSLADVAKRHAGTESSDRIASVLLRVAQEGGPTGDAAFRYLADIDPGAASGFIQDLGGAFLSECRAGHPERIEGYCTRLTKLDPLAAVGVMRKAMDECREDPNVRMAVQSVLNAHSVDTFPPECLALWTGLLDVMEGDIRRLVQEGRATELAEHQAIPRMVAKGVRKVEESLAAITQAAEASASLEEEVELAVHAAESAMRAARVARAIDLDGYGLPPLPERIRQARDAAIAACIARSEKARLRANLSLRQLLAVAPFGDNQEAFVVTPDESLEARAFWSKAMGGNIHADPFIARALELELMEARLASGHAGGVERDIIGSWAGRFAGRHAGVFRLVMDQLHDPDSRSYDSIDLARAAANGLKAGLHGDASLADPRDIVAMALIGDPKVGPLEVERLYQTHGAVLACGALLTSMESPLVSERVKAAAAAKGVALGLAKEHSYEWWGATKEGALNASRQVLAVAAGDPNPSVRAQASS